MKALKLPYIELLTSKMFASRAARRAVTIYKLSEVNHLESRALRADAAAMP